MARGFWRARPKGPCPGQARLLGVFAAVLCKRSWELGCWEGEEEGLPRGTSGK